MDSSVGFYDCIRPLSSHEDALYDPIVEDMFNNPSGQRHWDPSATGVTKEELKKKLMARWRNPSLTIHQVDVSGPKNRTVIPRSAKASVSMRIVPDQEVADITKSFEEHVRQVFGQLDTENQIEVSGPLSFMSPFFYFLIIDAITNTKLCFVD